MAEKKQRKPKPNPYNNPITQALIDIKRVLWDLGITLTDIDDILEEMNANEELRERASKLWLSHKFPDKSIKFIMSLIYDGCPERYELPVEEQAVLGLMERIQNQTNGAVAVYKTVFAKVLRLSDRQRKNLQRYLDHLTETGFLKCIYKPPKGSKKPGIYIVNRAVSWIGTSTDNVKDLKISNPMAYKQIPETVILPDGKKIICGSLGEWLPEEQIEDERVSTDQDADPINDPAEPSNGSAPQDDSTRDKRKNQDSTVNMQNVEEMFSGQMSFSDYPGVVPEGAKP